MPLCTFSWHSSKKRCNAWTATWDRFPSGSLEKTWPRLFMVDVSWCCGWLRNPALACRWFIPLSFRYVQCFIGLPIVTSCVHLEQLNFQEFSGAETFLTFWLANAPQAPQAACNFWCSFYWFSPTLPTVAASVHKSEVWLLNFGNYIFREHKHGLSGVSTHSKKCPSLFKYSQIWLKQKNIFTTKTPAISSDMQKYPTFLMGSHHSFCKNTCGSFVWK